MSSRTTLSFALRAAIVVASFSVGAMAAPSCSSDESTRPTGTIYGATSTTAESSAASSGSPSGAGGAGGNASTGAGGAGGSIGNGGNGGNASSGAGGNGGSASNGAGGNGGSASNGAGGAIGAGGGAVGAGGSNASDGGINDGGNACSTVIAEFPFEGQTHVAACSPVTYMSNPPTSGNHYPYWAKYQAYSSPVPRGFYVHDLEHGAIVITYNCPNGCDADVQALLAYLDTLPPDPLCMAPVKARYVITPDPLLDVLFAASAWTWSLKSNCFDLPALGTFITDHYAKGPENLCFDGTDVLDPDAGLICP